MSYGRAGLLTACWLLVTAVSLGLTATATASITVPSLGPNDTSQAPVGVETLTPDDAEQIVEELVTGGAADPLLPTPAPRASGVPEFSLPISAAFSPLASLSQVASPLQGDHNADWVVNSADFTSLRDSGSSVPAFDELASNFGATAATEPAGAAAVPEPSWAGLAFFVAIACKRWRVTHG